MKTLRGVLGLAMLVALGAVGIGLLLTVLVVLDGFVIYKLWGWFAVPLFGLPALTVAAAAGLSTLVGAFQIVQSKPKETEEHAWVAAFIRPPFYLLIGYVIQRWFL
jgi:hypothetical protein